MSNVYVQYTLPSYTKSQITMLICNANLHTTCCKNVWQAVFAIFFLWQNTWNLLCTLWRVVSQINSFVPYFHKILLEFNKRWVLELNWTKGFKSCLDYELKYNIYKLHSDLVLWIQLILNHICTAEEKKCFWKENILFLNLCVSIF